MSIIADEQIDSHFEKNVSVEGDDLPMSEPMSEAEHIEAVRKQIEYYFSKENLLNDPYLASQMDANMSVPLMTIMKFAKLKSLTQDDKFVRKSLEASKVVSLSGDRIRLIAKPQGRSTIILREIPSDATEDEIREIFNFEGCRPIHSMRPDIENTWFVVMESEDDVKDTVIDLQFKKRLFRGEKVKVRVKTESALKSFFPQPTAPVAPAIFHSFPGYAGMGMPVDLRQFPYVPSAPGPAVPVAPLNQFGDDTSKAASDNGVPIENQAPNGYDRKSRQPLNKDAKKGLSSQNGISGHNKRETGRKPGRGDRKNATSPEKNAQPIEIDSINFPPLGTNQSGDESPIPTPGFKGDVIKYTIDDVISIVKNVKDAVIPQEVHPEDHPYALTTTPNLDLLKRQRTFSIDETRDQLQQGRPVQRLAVSSGSVDYGSMMYGDGYNSSHVAEKAVKPTEQAVNSTPAPKVMTAGSWAALVKSVNSDTPAVKPTPTIAKTSPEPKATTSSSAPSSAKKASSPSPSNSNPSSPTSAKEAPKPKKATKSPEGDNTSTESSRDSSEESAPKSKTDERIAAASDAGASHPANETKQLSSWGGKPTFANILKQQAEASAKAVDTAPIEQAPHAEAPKDDSDNKKKSDRKPYEKKSKHSNGSFPSGSGSNADSWRRGNNSKSGDSEEALQKA